MSVTSILNYSNTYFRSFRKLLSDKFPTPKIPSKKRIKIRVVPRTDNFALIGNAFDYLLRFYLEYSFKEVEKHDWIADTAYEDFFKFLEIDKKSGLDTVKVGKLDMDTFNQKYESISYLEKVIPNRYSLAKQSYKLFLENGVLTEELLKSCLFLAKLDSFHRSIFYIPENMDSESDEDIQDLKSLFEIVNIEHFRPEKHIILNPTFGKASKMVNGADADLIIDNTLIEIKVLKELKISRPNFNQLIVYYLLSLIDKVDSEFENTEIKRIEIYFARHRYLWTIGIDEIADEKEFEKAKERLMKKFKYTNR